jgi:hypothetical protein
VSGIVCGKMDKIINAILSQTTDDPNDLKNLYQELKKSEDLLAKLSSHLDEGLVMLDPARHSLGWTFLLFVSDFAGHSFRVFLCLGASDMLRNRIFGTNWCAAKSFSMETCELRARQDEKINCWK